MDSTTMLSASRGVKLHETAHWDNWILSLREYSEDENIWPLIDPDVPNETRPATLDRPQLPGNFNDLELPAQILEMDVLRMLQDDWKIQHYALGIVESFIQASVEPHVGRILLNHDTLAERIQYLKGRFSNHNTLAERIQYPKVRLSNHQLYQRSLQYQWFGSFGTRSPRPGTDLIQWSFEWERLRDCVEADGNIQVQPNIVFMVAIQPVRFDFWRVWTYRMDRENLTISNYDLVNEFRNDIEVDRQFKKSSNNNNNHNNHKKKKKGNTDMPIKHRQCPCGNRYHKPWKCWIINSSLRPAGYTVQAWKQSKVDEKLKNDPEWKAYIEKRVTSDRSTD